MAILLLTLLVGCQDLPPISPVANQTANAKPSGGSGSVPFSPNGEREDGHTTAGSPSAPHPTVSPLVAPRSSVPRDMVVYAWQTSLVTAWHDPQENGAVILPYIFQYIMHDAVVKNLPGQPLAPSLAESYEVAPDYRSATFKLREGITFHNGAPVTPDDVRFSFENYRGANAQLLHEKTERIEILDARTVHFIFKEPFLDFLILYGTPASGAGWIVPKSYYQQVGPDGFKQNPIGAGPFKLVRHIPGQELEFEAFTDYWRHAPYVKRLVVRGVPEDATRLAQLRTGEADVSLLSPGPLVETVKQDPRLRLGAAQGAIFWLEMVGWEQSGNPFHDIRVRQAVSLALDREAVDFVDYAGMAEPVLNWIPDNWPGGLAGPRPEHDSSRAKQLLAEAGYPDGFEVEQLTPVTGVESVAERLIGQLRAIGIRTRLNRLERGAFDTAMRAGPNAITGLILNASGAPGDAMARIRAFATCHGVSSRTCVPEIEMKVAQYDRSVSVTEREQLAAAIQQHMWENYIFIGVIRQVAFGAAGPRIANSWEEIWGAIPQYSSLGPYEDIRVQQE